MNAVEAGLLAHHGVTMRPKIGVMGAATRIGVVRRSAGCKSTTTSPGKARKKGERQ
jgi:hypothetical protein